MEERLKQRLVGGAVLVSLIVIFVPMLLDEPVDIDTDRLETRIPEKPQSLQQKEQFQSILPPPLAPMEKLPEKMPQTQPQTVENKPVDKRVGKIERPTPTAWMIQVASFSKRDNAKKLMTNLRKAGLPAQLKEVTVSGKPRYRVHMLPQLDKKQAEKMVEQINREFKLKASLIRYPR